MASGRQPACSRLLPQWCFRMRMPRWQTWAANGTHGFLYALLLAMPLSGWLYNSAAGFPLKWFGLFSLPRLSNFNPATKHFALETHQTLFYVLAGLLVVHAAAALKHHYLDRDATLKRMLPWMGEPGREIKP